MKRFRWMVAALSLLACAPALPSTTPLGEGPLAEEEAQPKHVAVGSADESEKSEQEPAPEPKPAPKPEEKPAVADSEPAKPEGDQEASEKPESTKAPKQVYVGEYRGEDVTAFSLPAMPDREERDPNARLRVEKVGDDRLALVMIDTKSGKDMCRVETEPPLAKQLTLRPGQECDMGAGGGAVRFVVSGGKAQFDGRKLVLDFEMDVEMTMGPEQMTGSLSYHFEGERQ